MRTFISIAIMATTVAPAWSAQPQFDPPQCVSGADTYCQPIAKGPPPARLPANVPQ